MKKTLGFSLDQLLEDADFAYDNDMDFSLEKDSDDFKEIQVDKILPNPYQPRKEFDEESINELATSLSTHGLLQPIVVIRAGELAGALALRGEILDTADVEYFLIAGERRLRAAKQIGWNKIKAIIAAIEPDKTQELALIENIHREDLNPIELALAYESIMKSKDLTQEELATLVQKSRPVVANTLRLLKLSDSTKELVAKGSISAGHAKVIAGNLEKEKELVDAILLKGISVRECENLVSKEQRKKELKKDNSKILDEQEQKICEKLSALQVKFRLSNSKLTFDIKDEKTKEFLVSLLG